MTTTCAPPVVPGITSDERRYARNAHAPGIARRVVRAQLMEWGLDQVIDAAELIASELVTNALLHGGGDEIALRLEISGGVVCVRVWDASPDLPREQDPAGDDECGRGLMIVDTLALAWGAYLADEGGKVTWATCACAEATPPEAAFPEAAATEAGVTEATFAEASVAEAGRW